MEKLYILIRKSITNNKKIKKESRGDSTMDNISLQLVNMGGGTK